MNGIEKITEHILSDAKTAAEETILAAQAAADDTAKKYASLAADIRQRCADEAKAEADGIIERADASGGNVRRNMLLRTKSELIDAAFTRAGQSIRELPADKYTAFFANMLEQTITSSITNESALSAEYGDEFPITETYELRLCTADRKSCGDALLKAGQSVLEKYGKKLTFGDDAEISGGFILRAGDVEENCSLGTLVSAVRQSLESDVSNALFEQ